MMEVINCNLEQFKIYIEKIASENDLYLAGAGATSDIFALWLKNNNINWKGFIDKKLHGSLKYNKRIFDYNDINDVKNKFFIIPSLAYKDSIKSDLMRVGIKEENIITFFDHQSKNPFLEYIDKLLKNKYPNELWNCNKVHNIHKGKRAFIIGNGPSLKVEDLDKLKGELSFAVNSITSVYGMTSWRPTYYLNCDSVYLSNKINHFHRGEHLGITCTYNLLYKDTLDSLDNILFFNGIYDRIDNKSNTVNFSLDPNKCVYLTGSVLFAAFQLAVYMGISEIYLLGVDLGFKNMLNRIGEKIINKNAKHAYANFIENNEKSEREPIYWIDEIMCGYRTAKLYCDKHNIKVFNATRGGELEIFPRVDYDTLFPNLL